MNLQLVFNYGFCDYSLASFSYGYMRLCAHTNFSTVFFFLVSLLLFHCSQLFFLSFENIVWEFPLNVKHEIFLFRVTFFSFLSLVVGVLVFAAPRKTVRKSRQGNFFVFFFALLLSRQLLFYNFQCGNYAFKNIGMNFVVNTQRKMTIIRRLH